MTVKVGNAGKLLIIALIAVGAFFGAKWYQAKPKVVGEAKEMGDISIPDIKGASLPKDAVKLNLPSKNLSAKGDLLDIEWQKMMWDAQLATVLATGGKQTTDGSLMEAAGVNVKIKVQNDCNQSLSEFIKYTRDYAAGKRKDGFLVTYMASGIDNYFNSAAKQLKDLGPEFQPVVFLTEGRSDGEDQVLGDIKYKQNKQLLKGAILHGVKEDGDIDLGLKLAKENNIKVNADATLYYDDALNLSYAKDYLQAVVDYNANIKQKRKIVRNGKTVGDTLIGIDLVATWTPGDVNVKNGRGGVTIISTGIYKSIMPTITFGCKKFVNSNRDKLIDMTIAIGKAADQIKSFKDVKAYATSLEPDVWGQESKEYWLKYFDGEVVSPDLKLGGAQVFNLNEMANVFGTDGSRDIFKDIYNVFSKEHANLYPEDYSLILSYSDVVDKSILRSAIDKEKDKGSSLALSGQVEKTDYSKIGNETVGNKNYSIEFETGSAKIKSTKVLDDIAEDVNASDGLGLAIYGHTDNTGSDEQNIQLSRQRAISVKEYLISKGIEANRFVDVDGFGSTQPIADNNTAAGKAKNRRVQIELKH